MQSQFKASDVYYLTTAALESINMATANAADLPGPLRRDLLTYAANYTEWKRLNNVMNRIDKALKDWMGNNKVDHVETNEMSAHMAHPTRYMLDQSLVPDIDRYKVEKAINVCTIIIK